MLKKFIGINPRELFISIVIGILGLIGATVILLLINRNGAGTTPDSASYISAARNLAAGNGFLTYNETYLVVQPPLYPILLAIIKKITFIDPQFSAGYLNALLFGCIIYFSGLLLKRSLRSYALVILGTISVMISFALVQASLMALTESLFIFLIILFVYFFEKYKSQKDFISFILFTVPISLACLTRYTGVILIPAGIICIYLWGNNTNKEKFWHSLEFTIITIVPISFWVIRNYILSGTLTGERAASSYTLMENIGFFYNTVLPWYLPQKLTAVYSISILVIVTTWILYGFEKKKLWYKEVLNVIGSSVIIVIFYSGMIIVSSTTTAYDKISDRLLSPIFIPIIFILFFICDNILGWLRKTIRLKIIPVIFIFGIVVLMRHPIQDTSNVIEEYLQLSGWGYTSEYWKKSETIAYIIKHEQLRKGFMLYSNEPAAIYILAQLPAISSPAKTFYNSHQSFTPGPTDKLIWEEKKNVCLVWFNNTNRKFLYTIDELTKMKKMVEIASLKDGKIFTFNNKEITAEQD